jgi:hypothetical protein
MIELLTTNQLCKRLDLHRSHLQAHWLKEGCPVAKVVASKGKRANMYDWGEVIKWAAQHGKVIKGIKSEVLGGLPVTPDTPQRPSVLEMNLPDQLRLTRAQFKTLSFRFQELSQAHASGGELSEISKEVTSKSRELRQLEMTNLEYQKQTGELCNLAEMERRFFDLARGTRDRVMALSNELTPVLREYLKDPEDTGKVHDEIDRAIRHALTALPVELPNK